MNKLTLKKIHYYVEKSFQDKPSFVIEMTNNKQYISNGCVWLENTQENRDYLIDKYGCQYYLDELFNSPSIDMSSVTNAYCMFYNSKLKSFNADMSSVTDARFMFANTPYEVNHT